MPKCSKNNIDELNRFFIQYASAVTSFGGWVSGLAYDYYAK